jgi:single-stranded-DNA-specific exonuclease
MQALSLAQYLDSMNKTRRKDQDKILGEAIEQSKQFEKDPVLVLSDPDWNHGIVGIVASKLMEKYAKPTFVLQELGDESKGSARSFGDFNVVEAVNASQDIINGGGGHRFAAGVTLPTKNISAFRARVNKFYAAQKLMDQKSLMLPSTDATALLSEIDDELINLIGQLEPFGNGNTQPVLRSDNLVVKKVRRMGDSSQHVKLDLEDMDGLRMQFLAFSAPESFFVQPGTKLSVWYQPGINEWNNIVTIEGRLLHIEICD